MPTEEEKKDRLIQKQDRLAIANGKTIGDLQTKNLHLQGQIDILVAQLSGSEISQDMQDFITQQALGDANEANQEQAEALVTATQEVYRLTELLKEHGIEPNGDHNRLGN